MQKIDGESLNAAWPWTRAFLEHLAELRPKPFHGPHLLFGSDYGGAHSKSPFRTYGFLIADAQASPDWPNRCRVVRDAFLKDGRRMSFKNLNDFHRQHALIPFLEAAETLDGHVVVVAVTKSLTCLSTSSRGGSMEVWNRLHGFQAKWSPFAFEQMARIAHFFALFLGTWSSPGMHISWITDEDDIVANPERLDDTHQFAASLCGLYLRHKIGEFMMNTPAVISPDRSFEDFVAIPDLAAGMISEVLTVPTSSDGIRRPDAQEQSSLSLKSEIIADWFWHNRGTLKKSCILIDNAGKMFSVGKLRMEWE
jgi:hypothetical protein